MCWAGPQALDFFSYLGGLEMEVMQATRSIAECIVDVTTKARALRLHSETWCIMPPAENVCKPVHCLTRPDRSLTGA